MILRDGALYLVARVVPGALSVGTTAVLTHLMSPESYGTYGLALIIMSFGSTIAFEWLGLSFMRFFEARKDDPRTIPTFVALYLAMVVLSGAVMGLAILVGLVPADEGALFAVGMAMAWAFAMFELLSRMEIASFRPKRYLLLNVMRAILLSASTLAAAFLTRDALGTSVGAAIGLALSIVPMARNRLRVGPSRFDGALARQVISFGMPFAVSMLMGGLFTSGVRSLVAVLSGTSELGYYTAAYNLAQNVLFVIAGAIGSTTYPLAVRAFERGDRVALHAQLEENFTLLIGVMVPACIGMCLTSADLANTLVGPQFRTEVALLTPWMCLTVLLGSTRGVYLDHSFQLGKRTGTQMVVSAGAAVLALAGTLALVPWLGVVGAPIATTLAMAASCVHAWFAGRKGLAMPIPARPILTVAVAAGVMTVAVLLVPGGEPWSLYGKAAAGACCYAAVCIAMDLLGVRRQLTRRLTRRWRSVPG